MIRSFSRLSTRVSLPTASRAFSAEVETSWTDAWNAATENMKSNVTFEESAEILRNLTKTDLLRATDLRDSPSRFFEAHRILARHAVEHGPGFWIRFTVHYNLFAGTIVAAGDEEQVSRLADYQAAGELGCFGLTEKLAGVQSGLVVQTTATYDEASDEFILDTPHEGARKNWISQGFVADKAVVLADLIVKGESKGPHAFVMDFRSSGSLVPGVKIDDMGSKTVGNDLDNAWIDFENVRLPKDSMLRRYAEIVDGEYIIKGDVRPFDMIGQRLYTGRIAVAQAALEYRRALFSKTKSYSDSKKMFAFSGEPVLSEIPQLEALYEENEERLGRLDEYVGDCEAALSEVLKEGGTPDTRLVDCIATAKVKAVEDSIEMVHRLRQEVGSFALMADAGFKHTDFLQCCKFAEGDSRILMSKIARDRLRLVEKGQDMDSEEGKQALGLAMAMKGHLDKGASKQEAWDKEWKGVYELAETVMDRVMTDGPTV
ncbi:hypothetical protein TrVE_jg14271 [Triparma verrucosa]|uniref:Acyl-CoA oxidase n=1 Tax=Triparma verrucosa TaxID=1606542 RepID=A0A9W7C1Z7_9STRA|nr:hypothetical protein TrVE_jg14271 [Triparma verrucosa]